MNDILSYKLDSIECAEKLVTYCRKFDDDVDVIYQRYTIDAKSVLGVTSLVGNMVGVEILTMDENIKRIFKKGLEEL